jgi:hypothetical protein
MGYRAGGNAPRFAHGGFPSPSRTGSMAPPVMAPCRPKVYAAATRCEFDIFWWFGVVELKERWRVNFHKTF